MPNMADLTIAQECHDRLDNRVKSTIILPVEHICQKYNWDCGLACIAMVIKNSDARNEFLTNQKSILQQEELQTSIWTIDLAYILKHLNIEFDYYTETIGVNHDYKDEPYYSDVLDADTLRVTRKFNEGRINKVNIYKRILNLTEILCHLANNTIIALVDANYAKCCEITHSHKLGEKLASIIVHGCFFKNISYQGHYIVLVGYDSNKQIIYFNDPGLCEGLCQMSYEAFEIARTSHGTDQDLILILS